MITIDVVSYYCLQASLRLTSRPTSVMLTKSMLNSCRALEATGTNRMFATELIEALAKCSQWWLLVAFHSECMESHNGHSRFRQHQEARIGLQIEARRGCFDQMQLRNIRTIRNTRVDSGRPTSD